MRANLAIDGRRFCAAQKPAARRVALSSGHRGAGPAGTRRQANAPSTEALDDRSWRLLWKVYRWPAEPVDLSTSLHGPAARATWRLLWTVYGAKKPRQIAMAAERIGLASGQPKLLAALAKTYRVSPERARQICQRASEAATRIGPPQMLRAIVERLIDQDSCYEEDLIANLVNDGLLDRPLSLESITGVAKLYGIKAPQPCTRGHGRRSSAAAVNR